MANNILFTNAVAVILVFLAADQVPRTDYGQLLAHRFFNCRLGLAPVAMHHLENCSRAGGYAFAATVALSGVDSNIIIPCAVAITVVDFHIFPSTDALQAVLGEKGGSDSTGKLRVGAKQGFEANFSS
jgi:hypothetical protein